MTGRAAVLLVLALSFAGCSRDGEQAATAPGETVAEESAAAADDGGGAEAGRASRYTSVADCTVVREDSEEMPYVETRCDGPGGYGLRIGEADERSAIAVIAPDGAETQLHLARIGGGAFSSLGEMAEWRGPAGQRFTPDAVIVRYNLSENPSPEPPVPYLLAIRLGPDPCVVSKIAPGPAQSTVAQRRADHPGACLAD